MHFTLFISAFLAATLLPAQSEALLGFEISNNPDSAISLIIVATIGNVLGSIVNWALGLYCLQFQNKRWFPVKPHQLEKAQRHYKKYGRFSLLLSWVPFIGDPITVAAGVMREPLISFITLVTIAKALRYIFVALIVLSIF